MVDRPHSPPLSLPLLIGLCLWLASCLTATRPNTPFAGPVAEIRSLEPANPLLAVELRKLPEVRDGLTPAERTALARLARLYETDPSGFDAAFREMVQVGIPERRAYCTPLQALFWVAMERPVSGGNNPIRPYGLANLLEEAWTFQPRIPPDVRDRILASIKEPKLRKAYERDFKERRPHVMTTLLAHIKFAPQLFGPWVPGKLEELRQNDPWQDYDAVLERLNAPELVHVYVREQIAYANYWDIRGYNRHAGDARYVFKNKRGDCLYISAFVAEALRRNGYSAWVEKKPALRATDSWHAVCVFKENGQKYIIDDGKRSKHGIMRYEDY